jgi:sugar/nucleoside kinase (ribokinase family)
MASTAGFRPRSRPISILILGDLMLDVVLAPDRTLAAGTDVSGRVRLRQGGSAANTARWAARLGARTILVSAVGRDLVGRALVEAVAGDGVTVRAARVAGLPSGRIGVVVAPGGERSFVADRGAADALAPDHLRAAWFRRIDAFHLPAYSLLSPSLAAAARAGLGHARAAGATISLDLASSLPLLSQGRRAARGLVAEVRPDILFATAAEAEALLGRYALDDLLDFAPIAVVKRGARGALVLAAEGTERIKFEVATSHVRTAESTGAGDAFDAGFLVAWLGARARGRSLPEALHRATLAGHRAAARHLVGPRPEIVLG